MNLEIITLRQGKKSASPPNPNRNEPQTQSPVPSLRPGHPLSWFEVCTIMEAADIHQTGYLEREEVRAGIGRGFFSTKRHRGAEAYRFGFVSYQSRKVSHLTRFFFHSQHFDETVSSLVKTILCVGRFLLSLQCASPKNPLPRK